MFSSSGISAPRPSNTSTETHGGQPNLLNKQLIGMLNSSRGASKALPALLSLKPFYVHTCVYMFSYVYYIHTPHHSPCPSYA